MNRRKGEGMNIEKMDLEEMDQAMEEFQKSYKEIMEMLKDCETRKVAEFVVVFLIMTKKHSNELYNAIMNLASMLKFSGGDENE
ncbi:hypothetical protein DMB44_05455 [Thermoplasma sp. Kam2015]|uniref:hypothetical protein n=1 Tax=Thermoplasma sp. Kam2015 TaxID=2094122 RepID=UPI000D89C204|nr:hypothetical protein [Thermoplasma sp. Kam2015]PYB68168.1 hypothetical protein DMB44_05455 [Thermoplasma sp. Kam2015]